MVEVKRTKIFRESMEAHQQGYRLIANQGGTRSGKTYSLMMYLLVVALQFSKNIDVVSESFPHLRRGALKDIEDILMAWGMLEGEHYRYHKTDHTYSIPSTGSSLRFFSADDWGKVKGSRRDILFINEANRIPYETYRQLAVRTTETIFIDWNPDSEYWFEEKGLATSDKTKLIQSTYKDNPFLGEVQIAEIESNKSDEAWWKVYGLGQVGRPQGLIYTNWEQVREIPQGAQLIARGLDFGFTNDPTAIVAVYRLNGELYIDEELYAKGLTNDKISQALKGKNGRVVADSAEMKSITEIYNMGVRGIEPAKKGADSVRNGIQILKRYKMHITQRSLNIIYELRNYKWQEDRINGTIKNQPIDKYNHALDALRYVALNSLTSQRVGQIKATVTRL